MHNIRDLIISNSVPNLHVAVKMYEYMYVWFLQILVCFMDET